MAFSPLSLSTSSVSGLSAVSNLINAISGLLIASPTTIQGYQPQNPVGPTGLLSLLSPPPSLLFHYEGEQTATLSSDVTDHFIENNTAVQDQVALKPIIITTRGFIGELNNVPPAFLGALQTIGNTLTSITPYNPALTLSAVRAYNTQFSAYQAATTAQNSAVSAVSSLSGSASGETVIGSIGSTPIPAVNQNKQQVMFQQLYGYWSKRTQFTIQTPWAIFKNMIIMNCRAIQDEATRTVTDFQVTFKQINFASTTTTNVTQGQLQSQSAAAQNNGNVSLNPSISGTQGIVKQLGSG